MGVLDQSFFKQFIIFTSLCPIIPLNYITCYNNSEAVGNEVNCKVTDNSLLSIQEQLFILLQKNEREREYTKKYLLLLYHDLRIKNKHKG